MTSPSDPRQGAAPEYDAPDYGEPAGGGPPDNAFSLYAERAEGAGSAGGTGSFDRGFNTLVNRPPEMWAGAVFLTLAAVPVCILGGGLALQPGQFGTNLQQKVNAAGTAISAGTLLTGFRAVGALLAVLAVVFIYLAWTAIRPNPKARLWAVVLAVVEVVGLALTMAVTAADPVSIGVGLLAAAGAVLLYLPRSEEFTNARR